MHIYVYNVNVRSLPGANADFVWHVGYPVLQFDILKYCINWFWIVAHFINFWDFVNIWLEGHICS